MLISEDYREQNRLLHEQRPDYGKSGGQWAEYIHRLMSEERIDTVLDYGCGKGILGAALAQVGKKIAEYDPAVAGKDAEPEPAELVVCTDVLEHIEPVHLNAVLRDLRRLTQRKLFFNIATRKAGKLLPDGRNAHLIIKDGAWWRQKLEAEFHILMWEERGMMIYGEAVPASTKITAPKPTKRLQVTLQWKTTAEQIMADINKYADAFTKVSTYSFWQGIDDEPADLQLCVNVIDTYPDPDVVLKDVAKLSYKATAIVVKFDAARPEQWWKRLMEKRFRLAQWFTQGDSAMMIGAPMVGVQGVIAVGAVDTDKRWDQVKLAAERIKTRFTPAPPHEKRALVACYGPSLADNLDHLRTAAAGGGIVISVSGAHDYLLANGIVPTYHIECDPRPHKTDNIAKGHPDVTYLLGSACHPSLFDRLEGSDIRLWHVSTPEHATRLVDEMGESPQTVISGGGSVGLRSLTLFYAMGYRSFSFFGMDCSFKFDGDPNDPQAVQQWAGAHAGKKQDITQAACGSRVFISSPILLTYASNFFETIQKVNDIDIRLYGDGLLQSMADYLSVSPQLDNVETVAEKAA